MSTLFRVLESGQCTLREGSEARKTLDWIKGTYGTEAFDVGQFTRDFREAFGVVLGTEFPRPANSHTLRRRIYYLWESGHLAKSDGWSGEWQISESWQVLKVDAPTTKVKELSIEEVERLFSEPQHAAQESQPKDQGDK